ncbi:MAG: sugar phosphate nucleotidyltransferase [Proteobacteria bacterium]|nr:sugar phosphate nucleotidyltransferase [Pseudomonadota bacterium]
MDTIAMILAGARVDDLGVLTFFRPKSAMPYGGLYRIIDFPMSNLMYSGIEKVGILSQYKPLYLMEHMQNGEPWDMNGRDRFVTILPPFKGMGTSDWYKGTADAVYQNLDFLSIHKPGLIIVLSGDHIYKMDYRKIIGFHLEKGADLTIAFAKVPRKGAHRFGTAAIEEGDSRGGRVLQYTEKSDKIPFDWASLTIYVFTPYTLFEALKANASEDSHEFGKDIIPFLLANNYKVFGYKHHGYWGYTRTLDEYWQTSMDLLGDLPGINIASWHICTNLSNFHIRDRQPALIGPDAIVEDSMFYSGCRIKGKVIRSILFPGAKVDSNAVVEDSILFSNTVIKQNAKVIKTIIDEDVTVGTNAHIGENSSEELTVIGMGTRIARETRISSGVTIYPNLGPGKFTKSFYSTGEIIK